MLFVSPVMEIPPVAALYHRYCPTDPPDADKITEEDTQPVAAVVTGAIGGVLIVAITDERTLSHMPSLIET